MLSISVLSDSDSIHRNTRIAGDTRNSTDSQKPIRRSDRLAADGAMHGLGRLALHSRPLRLLPHVEQQQRQREDDDEEHDHHRRRIADVVERERLQIEVEVDRLRRGAGAALRDHVDRVERLQARRWCGSPRRHHERRDQRQVM